MDEPMEQPSVCEESVLVSNCTCRECGKEYDTSDFQPCCDECFKKVKEEGRVITEEANKELIEDWFKQANDITLDTLPEFLNKLCWYYHDYGTIVYAVTAGAIAAAKALNGSPQGGISGFQASCIMWEFIQRWMHLEGPAKLMRYENMLYPQYRDIFDKTISGDTWEYLQKKAQEKLDIERTETPEDCPPGIHPEVLAHWESIVKGEVPFGYAVAVD